MQIMKQLATSPAADPSLSVQMEDQNRLAMEAGTAAFEINYPFVYPSMKSDNPKLFKVFKYAPYPGITPGTHGPSDHRRASTWPSASYSKHKALDFAAALCLRDQANQIEAATVGGLPPTLHLDLRQSRPPRFVQTYPFYQHILPAADQRRGPTQDAGVPGGVDLHLPPPVAAERASTPRRT